MASRQRAQTYAENTGGIRERKRDIADDNMLLGADNTR